MEYVLWLFLFGVPYDLGHFDIKSRCQEEAAALEYAWAGSKSVCIATKKTRTKYCINTCADRCD